MALDDNLRLYGIVYYFLDGAQLFFLSYSSDIYVGRVIAAMCNCIPGSDVPSASLNCQQYQLDSSQDVVNATLLTRGECAFEEYGTVDSFPQIPVCSVLGNRLVTSGM